MGGKRSSDEGDTAEEKVAPELALHMTTGWGLPEPLGILRFKNDTDTQGDCRPKPADAPSSNRRDQHSYLRNC
jgi:hypothetical protein